ncbi:MAG: hypothetical protein HKO58_02600, partial [Gammaproteobacteria bacterium]|nr:hypothetical protein [Gammaproteobacteria bacterium]
MKKLILASLSALLLLGACTQKSDSSTIDNPLNLADHLKGDNTVVAKVGGQNVYKSEFANYAKTRSQQ